MRLSIPYDDQPPRAPRDDSDRYVFTDRPRCPKCNSVRLWCYRTMPTGADEEKTRYMRCLDCGHKLIHIAV